MAGNWTLRHLQPVNVGDATGLVKTVYQQLKRDFGILAPPVTLHAGSPELLAGAWMALRETLVAGPVARHLKETVAITV